MIYFLLILMVPCLIFDYVTSHNHGIKYISKDALVHDPTLAWHLNTPTIGLYSSETFNEYFPYNFNLWQLAPKKGLGVKLTILDTGVAAFQIVGAPQYKKHDALPYTHSSQANYNCCSPGLRWFTRTIKKFLQPTVNPLEEELISIIKEYCFDKSTQSLVPFLKKYGKNNLFDEQGTLTIQGKEAIWAITEGRKGIMPYGKIRFFTPVTLEKPYKQKEILEFLPAIMSHNNLICNARASHGTHVYGLITALAPQASCSMIKACNDEGISDAETLTLALQKAASYHPDIVTLSLKVECSVQSSIIEELLKNFQYVVAASGNDNQALQSKKEGYPACLACIPFDIGALYYDKGNYGICSYSQYEKDCGPKFVAPGCAIVSTCIPCSQGDYLTLSGTSMAAAIMSGFVALMLSEFKDYFTREQLLKVCYSSGVRLNTTPEWHEKCLLGALDMRTALCILHICRALKEAIGQALFEEKYEACIVAIKTLLTYKATPAYSMHRQFKNLSMACHYYVSLVRSALDRRKLALFPSQDLFEQIVEILHRPSVDLFESYDIKIKKRLLAALEK